MKKIKILLQKKNDININLYYNNINYNSSQYASKSKFQY